MQDVWRLFAAIELPDEVRERVAEVAARLRTAGWRARWANPAGVHLTLKFYGNVPRDRIDGLRTSLRSAVVPVAPFSVQARGAGVFPGLRRPRVLWLGVDGQLDRLKALQRVVEDASAAEGFAPEERAFNPHLTVARFQPEDLASLDDLDRRLREIAALPGLDVPVANVTLFRSELRRTGAVYTPIEAFPLRGERG